MAKAHVNGLTLDYRVIGPEDAPPMLLLHGRAGSQGDWDSVLGHFAENYRVHTLDLRGHGASDFPGDYALTTMSDDVAAFIEDKGIAGVVVIGHSLGGVVAYLLAMRYPGLVGRLILEDAPAPLPIVRPPLIEDDTAGFDWLMMHATERQIANPDPTWWEGLITVNVPTLVISGGPTSHLALDRTVTMAGQIPGADLITIDVGHLIHTSAPDEFVKAVDEWLAT